MTNPRRSRLNAVTIAALVLSALPAIALSAPAAQGAAPAAARGLWTKTAQKPQASLDGHRRSVNPSAYRAYTLNQASMGTLLAAAPNEDSAAARRGGTATVSVPAPTGELIEFAVVDSPVMEDELAAANPQIRTYAGSSVTDGYEASIRLDQTLLGFHASVIGPHKQAWYVDPAYIGDTSLYLSYWGESLPAREKAFTEPRLDQRTQRAIQRGAQRVGPANGVVSRREYRLALVNDDSYATYFSPSSTVDATSNPLVLSAKNTLMARVNQIYNNDLAVKMLLVNGSDKLNFQTQAEATGTNGPCGGAACYSTADFDGCGDVIDKNTHVLAKLIGAENYDIGHIVFGADGDGGGVAYLGAVGEGDIKGGGCTGLDPPVGDGFAIDYVAHEMGHEFAGNHTFNGSNGSCASNGEASASVEPGSGTSVMAYAGICAQDDLQPHSDPYFSQKSQDEITAHITGATTSYNEIQEYGLSGFTAGEAFKLDFAGTQTAAITSGSNYTAAGLKAAIEAAIGGTVTASSVSATGFTLTYSGAKANTNIANPTVVVTAGTFTAVGGDYVKGGPGTNQGAFTVLTSNHNPTVTAPAAKTIPIRTPFTLTGSGTDSDGNTLTYLWEQNNPGTGAGTLGAHASGPLFRVFGKYAPVTGANTLFYNSPNENLADTNPSRTFPDMEQVVANETNAEGTGTCAALTETSALPDNPKLRCHSEFLPNATYTPSSLTFRLTARDGVADGGGVQAAQVVLTLDKTKGPFLVSAPNTAVSYVGNSTQTVTWTSGLNTLSANVKISLSTDGGTTYPTVLLASTPNDGSQAVTIPNTPSTNARIKVEAVENYFFDIGNTNFIITSAPATGLVVTQPTNPTQSVQYSDAIASVGFSATTDNAGAVLAASIDPATPLPAGLSLSARSGTDTAASWTITGTTTAGPGVFPVTAKVTDGTQTTNVPLTFTVTQESATATYTGPTSAVAPSNGTGVVSVPLTATVTQQADGSLGDLTTGTATFVDNTTGDTLCVDSALSATGDASCSFNADSPRVYSVKVNVGGRFTGTTASNTTLTVATVAPNGLVVTQPDNPSQSVQYSDAIATVVFSATTDRPGGVLAASVDPTTPLPNGLTLSTRNGSDTSAFWQVTGTANVAPGVYNVTIKVTDGTQTVDVPLTFTVTQESATPTYTGPTSASASPGGDHVNVSLTATVAQQADGSLGDLANATATFRDTTTNTDLCSSPVTSGGAASCTYNAAAPGTFHIKVNITGRFTGTTASDTTLTTTVQNGLLVTQPSNPTQSVQYSDPIATVTIAATTDRPAGVLGASIDPATPLPNGLSLSARSGTDASASWTVTGAADVAPGTYNVTAKVTDGTQTTNVPLTFTVTAENATPTYTGPTTVPSAAGEDHVDVDLTATVAQAPDGSLGDLTKATATFTDTTSGDTLCASAVTAAGEAACTFSASAPHTYAVKVTVGGRYTGATETPTTLTVTATPLPVPDTELLSAPSKWLVSTTGVFDFRSTLFGSTFQCTLDGASPACSPPYTATGLTAGSHVFTVAATKAGQTDPTPARVLTTVPVDDRALKDRKGAWKRRSSSKTFLGTFTGVHKKGATLSYKVTDARSLALVATTGKRAGKVKIFLGSTLLKTVNLKAPRTYKVVIDLGTFLSPTSGRLKIVTQSNAPVKIDGLGVATQL